MVLQIHIVKFASFKLLTYSLHNAYNNQALTISKTIIFLGMHMDCHLSWKSHIDNLVKKLSSVCLMLRKLLPIVNLNILQMVYFAHFYSQISYGIIFWGSSSSMRNVFIIQNRAIGNMLRLGQKVLVERVSKNWIYLQLLVYIFMPWCYLALKI